MGLIRLVSFLYTERQPKFYCSWCGNSHDRHTNKYPDMRVFWMKTILPTSVVRPPFLHPPDEYKNVTHLTQYTDIHGIWRKNIAAFNRKKKTTNKQTNKKFCQTPTSMFPLLISNGASRNRNRILFNHFYQPMFLTSEHTSLRCCAG